MKESYKPYETEEILDYFFYRPIASYFVKAVQNTSITPNQITVISLVFGMVAGVFLSPYYSIPFVGIILLAISNILDCSDGQLARVRKSGSMAGRVFDGLADSFVFFSIYLFSCLKFNDTYGWYIWAIAVVASVGHSMQSSFFDYYRNEYISFVIKNYKSEATTTQTILNEIDLLKNVKGKWFDRFLLRFYYLYTKIQEKSNKKNTLRDKYEIPKNFADTYREKNRVLLRFWSVLGATAHITYVMIFAAFDRMDLYFIFEAGFLNIYMIVMKIIQNRAIYSIEKKLLPFKQ
ncbi:MAG: CDP-alcohol phosphatidyltransferase family protein [Spirochaetota bacterium]|nr:CDP-alcohol phosphatidyltransferase family protein [Spirochaetota bacterium]